MRIGGVNIQARFVGQKMRRSGLVAVYTIFSILEM